MAGNNSKPTIDRAAEPVHPTRAFETWTDDALHNMEDRPWEHAASLAAPEPRPGFAQRWIRVASRGVDDATNTARKFREGWRPRLAETVPGGFQLPTISHGHWAGCIGVEGMILCEMPLKLSRTKAEAIKARNDLINKTLESDLQGKSHSAMPITQERKSTVMREVKAMEDK